MPELLVALADLDAAALPVGIEAVEWDGRDTITGPDGETALDCAEQDVRLLRASGRVQGHRAQALFPVPRSLAETCTAQELLALVGPTMVDTFIGLEIL